MTRLTIAATLALFAAAPLLAEQEKGDTVEASDPEAARIVADCSARKFESSIEIDKDGQKRLTTFKLCAIKDSNDAAWVRTLKDARAKIAAHPDISAESKASIAAQLDVEIAKYANAGPASPAPALVQQTPPVSTPVSTIVPTPAPKAAPVATVTASSVTAAAAKPRLTIKCLSPGEKGAGSSCSSLDRATRLSIQADADLGGGASLRFLRRGDLRGEVGLSQMRQGELYSTKLPAELCAGVASSKVEIQVVGGKRVVDTLGPFNLRC